MAKSTNDERRLRRVGAAKRCEDRARARRLDADYAERGGDFARAEIYRKAAEQHEAMARQHRQEAARLAQRAKARRYQSDPAAKARQARQAISAALVGSDTLDRGAAVMAEIAAIRAEIARMELALSELPRQGAEARQARLAARIEEHRAWALEWEGEAARLAQASP